MKSVNSTKIKLNIILLIAAFLILTVISLGTPQVSRSETPINLKINFDNSQVNSSISNERILELLVETKNTDKIKPPHQLPPLNLVLVIDRSGSMSRDKKLEMAKIAAKEIIGRLQPNDQFSLITYDDKVDVILPPSSQDNARRAEELIDTIIPGGSTNLGGGLKEGYRQARIGIKQNAISKIFLLSDGLANVGVTSPNQLNDMAENEASERISLSTFGVGLDFNENLMADLSEHGRGMYYFIDDSRNIEAMLTKEFNATRHLAARDVRLTIRWNTDVKVHEVFANSFQQRDQTLVLQAGDIPVGDRRRIQLRLAAPLLPYGQQTIGTVRMDYRIPGVEREGSVEVPLKLSYVRPGTPLEEGLNEDVVERSRIFEAQYIRARAAEAVEHEDIASARKALEDNLRMLRSIKTNNQKLLREVEQSNTFLESLDRKLSGEERVRERKAIKYRKYMLEGC